VISVLVPYRSDNGGPRDERWHFVRSFLSLTVPHYEVVVGQCDDGPFNRAQALNRAASNASGDVFLTLDADTVFKAYFCQFPEIHSYGWMVTERYVELTPETTEQWLEQGCPSPLTDSEILRAYPNFAGALYVTKEAFYTVGGYDERFQGWGYEDAAFALSVGTMVGDPLRLVASDSIHLWHPINVAEQWEQPLIEENQKLCARYVEASTDSNKMARILRERNV
jgi:N-terminal domain of galactosyltransferase